MRLGVQVADVKSIPPSKVDILWAMGDSKLGLDSYSLPTRFLPMASSN